ncbi:hypothetical protein NPA08_03790 [Mycoplasmopsis citelli]|uniref:hypothetical protein n=1 Tax=Mycoplasmopsis citelli TaxID=171281 RepID=UPI002114BAB1|nr:hypothetical protein [Mycoplasmopsis citelli]UUD36049.1 hypothetical protein NPA08_03790 [Mycoplasmopsis citelli]
MNSFYYGTMSFSIGTSLFLIAIVLIFYFVYKSIDKDEYRKIFKAVYIKVENLISFKDNLIFDKKFLKGYEIIKKEA